MKIRKKLVKKGEFYIKITYLFMIIIFQSHLDFRRQENSHSPNTKRWCHLFIFESVMSNIQAINLIFIEQKKTSEYWIDSQFYHVENKH